MTDVVQEYQLLKQKHRQAEINIAKAKAQVDVYKNDIAKILKEENVASIEELCSKYTKEQENLQTINNLLKTEIDKAEIVLNKLGIV